MCRDVQIHPPNADLTTEFQGHFLLSCLLEISTLVALELNKLQSGIVIFPFQAASTPLFYSSAGGITYAN